MSSRPTSLTAHRSRELGKPVVVTGLGMVSSSGRGVLAFADALRRGTVQLTAVDRHDYHRFERGAHSAALVDDACLAGALPPRQARRMSRPSRFAVVAALEAVAQREEHGAVDWGSAATSIGTCYGPSAYTEGLLRQVAEEGPQAASPVFFIESVANAPAAQVALRLRCRGANVTITQREASGLLAIDHAARSIAAGEISCALAGAVEELNPLLHSVLDRYGALARQRGEMPEAARPFGAGRNGFVAAEGATVLALEREGEGGGALARLVGVVRAFDPTAPATSWGSGGELLAAALVRGLERLACDIESIDLVVSGANGSPSGDGLEAAVLREVWSNRLPPILTPKAVSGEFAGGPIGAAVLACTGADLGGGVGSLEPGSLDTALGLGSVPVAKTSSSSVRRVLVSALAAGGAAAWLVLETCAR